MRSDDTLFNSVRNDIAYAKLKLSNLKMFEIDDSQGYFRFCVTWRPAQRLRWNNGHLSCSLSHPSRRALKAVFPKVIDRTFKAIELTAIKSNWQRIKSSLSLPPWNKSRRTAALDPLLYIHKMSSSDRATTLSLSKPSRAWRRLHNEWSYKIHFGRNLAFICTLPHATELWNRLPDVCNRDHEKFRNELSIYE